MLVTYETFRDVPLPEYDPIEPVGSWPVRSSYTDLASDGSYRLNGSDRSKKGRKTLRRTGTLLVPIVTTDQQALIDLWSVFALLEAEQGNTGRLYGRTPIGTRVWTQAELSDVQVVRQPRDVFRFRHYVALDVDTEFILNTPAWYAESPASILGVDLFDDDDEDLATVGAEGDAIGGTSTFFLTSTGNLPSTRVVFTITSGTGTITDAIITNVTTGHVLMWTGTLGPGEALVINAGNERVRVDGVLDWSGLTEPPDKERWFEIVPGDNAMTVDLTDSATDDSSTIAVSWDPTSA
jgi:hypothetical protein